MQHSNVIELSKHTEMIEEIVPPLRRRVSTHSAPLVPEPPEAATKCPWGAAADSTSLSMPAAD